MFDGDLATQKPGLNLIEPFLSQLERHKTRSALVGYGIVADGTKMNPMTKRKSDQLLEAPMLDMGVVGGELLVLERGENTGQEKYAAHGTFKVGDFHWGSSLD